jgi:3-hydroxy-9,10-secoandrosta-1,3,5(10)-triene-9,17-dione monooxygenase reductase component
VSISPSDPFATPDHLRSPLRRLRGRLPAAVTLWTAPGPAGLTVSSMFIVDGDPGRLAGIVDEESDLWAAVEAAGRFAVTALTSDDRQLADRFAGLLPAPGGLFAATADWTDSDHGPVPVGHDAWAGCRLDAARPFGYGLLVEATIETVEVGGEAAPLVHHRGRYHSL